MSNLFFDHLLDFSEIDSLMKEINDTEDEKHEMWRIFDELVHHHVLGCVFDHLPAEHHEEFLIKLHDAPHDPLLIHFINERASVNFSEVLKAELKSLEQSILAETLKG